MALRIVVTGADGQLATQLKRLLEKEPHDFTARFANRELWDVTSREMGAAFLKDFPCDVIVNCAAYTAVDAAEENAQTAMRVNAEAPAILLALAEEVGAKIIHISTDYVAGPNRSAPLREDSIANPQGIYAKSKRQGEIALLGSPHAMVIRTSWLYSIFGHNFFNTMRARAMEGLPSNVVDDQIGTPTWAGELARGILQILRHEVWEAGLFHFSNAGVASWYDFAYAIYEAFGKAELVTPIPSASYPQLAPRPEFSVLSCQKFREHFHYAIPHWHKSLTNCVAQFDGANSGDNFANKR